MTLREYLIENEIPSDLHLEFVEKIFGVPSKVIQASEILDKTMDWIKENFEEEYGNIDYERAKIKIDSATPESWEVIGVLGYNEKEGELQPLKILIQQADATDEEIADILSDISILYRMKGGSGIVFEPNDVHELNFELV